MLALHQRKINALSRDGGLPDGLYHFVGVADGVEAGEGLAVLFDALDEVIDDGCVVADVSVPGGSGFGRLDALPCGVFFAGCPGCVG